MLHSAHVTACTSNGSANRNHKHKHVIAKGVMRHRMKKADARPTPEWRLGISVNMKAFRSWCAPGVHIVCASVTARVLLTHLADVATGGETMLIARNALLTTKVVHASR